jgi:hypothetical protein
MPNFGKGIAVTGVSGAIPVTAMRIDHAPGFGVEF